MDGDLAMHRAVIGNDIDVVRTLLSDNKTNLKRQNKEGKTPMHLTVSHQYHQILEILMERDGNVTTADWEGLTPLHVAASDGDVISIRMLLNSTGGQQSLSTLSKTGDTPLHMACQKGQIEAARILINNNVSIDDTNNYGATPLYYSIANGHEELTWFLLDNGAKLSNIRGDPIGAACARGQNTFVHRLLSR